MMQTRERLAIGAVILVLAAGVIYMVLRPDESARRLESRSSVVDEHEATLGPARDATAPAHILYDEPSTTLPSTTEDMVPSSSDPTTFDVVGTVIGFSGRPIAGARIAADSSVTSIEGMAALCRRDNSQYTLLQIASSGVDGRFVLRNMIAGRISITVRAEGYATHHENDRLIVRAGADLGRIALLPGKTVRGRVMRSDGTSIAGVRVAMVSIFGASGVEPGAMRDAVTTDDRGAFVFRDAQRGDCSILVDAGDGVIQWKIVSTTVCDWVPIVVERATSLGGNVTSSNNRPLGGASLLYYEFAGDEGLYAMTRADATGKYEIHGLDEDVDDAALFVWADGHHMRMYGRFGITISDGLPILGPEGNTLDIRLDAGIAVKGRIFEQGSKIPIAGARVRYFEGAIVEPQTAVTTDAEGRFEIDGVVPGVGWYAAEMSGWELVTGSPEPNRRRRRGPPGALKNSCTETNADLQLEMTRAATITGRVVDSQGEPVEGAAVVWTDRAWSETDFPAVFGVEDIMPRVETSSDEAGAFSIAVPRSETVGRLVARRAGESPGQSDEIVISGLRPLESVEIRLPHHIVVEGRVVDVSGIPIRGAWISPGDSVFASGGSTSTVSDEDGRFRLAVIDDTRIAVQVWHEDYASEWRELDTSARTAPVEFRLERLETLRGHVTDALGGTREGLRIEVRRSPRTRLDDQEYRDERTTLTNESGSFLVRGLRQGTYEVEAFSAFHTPMKLEVTLPHDDFDITFDRSHTVVGSVVRDGRPVAGVTAILVPLDSTSTSMRRDTSQDGRFAFSEVVDGLYRLEFLPSRDSQRSGNVRPKRLEDVTPGGPPLHVELEAGLVIEGRLEGPIDAMGTKGQVMAFRRASDAGAGSVIASKSASFIGRSRKADAAAPSDLVMVTRSEIADGRFRLIGLEPGLHHIVAAIDGLAVTSLRTVEAGTTDLNLSRSSGSGVRGRLVDRRGAPIADAEVHLHRPNDVISETATSEDGVFRFGGLIPGDFRIVAQTWSVTGKTKILDFRCDFVDVDLGDIAPDP